MPPVQEEDISEKDEREEAEAPGAVGHKALWRHSCKATRSRWRCSAPPAQGLGHLRPHLFVSAWSEVFELQATPGDLVATKAKAARRAKAVLRALRFHARRG